MEYKDVFVCFVGFDSFEVLIIIAIIYFYIGTLGLPEREMKMLQVGIELTTIAFSVRADPLGYTPYLHLPLYDGDFPFCSISLPLFFIQYRIFLD